MIRILLLLFITGYAHTVTPMVTIVRRVHYSRTQYLVPCIICQKALLYQMKSPSPNHIVFQERATEACRQATPQAFQQKACISLLTRNARLLLREQRKRELTHRSCVRTFMTDCVEYQARFAVVCDDKKKKDNCHAIPVY